MTTTNGTTAMVRATSAAAMARDADYLPPMSFDQLVAMGTKLQSTGFLPEHIRTGAQAAAIIMTGRELGMGVMRSLRSLAMVKGKVTEYADSQLARFKSDGGHARFLRLDDKGATLWLRHPNGDEHEETFTIDDAKAAGLTGSGMYQKHPKAMLRSRAITAGLKSIGWEGGTGTYDPSEMVEPPAPPQRTVVPVEAEWSEDDATEAAARFIERIAAAESVADLAAIASEVSAAKLPKALAAPVREAYRARKAAIETPAGES